MQDHRPRDGNSPRPRRVRENALSERRAKPLPGRFGTVAAYLRTSIDPGMHNAHSQAGIFLIGCRIADEHPASVHFGHEKQDSKAPAAPRLLVAPCCAPAERFRDSVWPHTADMFARGAAFGRNLLYAPPLRQSAASAMYPGLHCANHQPAPVPTGTRTSVLKSSSNDGTLRRLIRLVLGALEARAAFSMRPLRLRPRIRGTYLLHNAAQRSRPRVRHTRLPGLLPKLT